MSGFDFESLGLPPSVRRRRLGPDRLTRALVVALGLALAFSAGVQAGRASRPPAAPAGPASGSSPAPLPPSGGPAAAPPTAGPQAPESGAAVTGRVDIVDRNVLYVTDRQGRRVKVVVPEGAKLSSVRAVSRADLHVGDTVVVHGEQAPDGTVSAASVVNDGFQ